MKDWALLQDINRARAMATRKFHPSPPPVQTLIEEFGVDPMLIGQWMYLLDNYNRETISAAHYLYRNLYYHPQVLIDLFNSMAASGLLEPTGVDDPLDPVYGAPDIPASPRYRMTHKGLRLFHRTQELMMPRFSIPPVEDDDFDRLLVLLRRVVEATQCAPTPPERWAVDVRTQHGMKVPQDAPPLQKIHYITFDLWAYRDDVHTAAWREPYPDVTPRAWEAFSTVWRSEAQDAAALVKVLQEHGFSDSEYSRVLTELVERGWVVEQDGVYSPSDHGKQLRQEVEDQTDHYFYVPWDTALSTAERHELTSLMRGLIGKLESAE